jgi:hypothetical protein
LISVRIRQLPKRPSSGFFAAHQNDAGGFYRGKRLPDRLGRFAQSGGDLCGSKKGGFHSFSTVRLSTLLAGAAHCSLFAALERSTALHPLRGGVPNVLRAFRAKWVLNAFC